MLLVMSTICIATFIIGFVLAQGRRRDDRRTDQISDLKYQIFVLEAKLLASDAENREHYLDWQAEILRSLDLEEELKSSQTCLGMVLESQSQDLIDAYKSIELLSAELERQEELQKGQNGSNLPTLEKIQAVMRELGTRTYVPPKLPQVIDTTELMAQNDEDDTDPQQSD